MKNRVRLTALLLSAVLALTGCTSILERSVLSVTPHSETPASAGSSSILRVETYSGLRNAILYFALQGQEEGTLRLYNYERNVDADMNAACLEVTRDDPLGAYALDFIRFEVAHIVSYYEVDIYFTYRRTREQMDRIVSVVGTNAIRQELCAALAGFRPEAAVRVGYFNQDEEYLCQLLRQAYYDTPLAAFGMPQVSISLYPDSGQQRIVEFQLTYPFGTDQLLDWQEQLAAEAEEAAASLEGLSADRALERLVLRLHRRAGYSPTGPSSLRFLLTGEPACGEGLALAMVLYCKQLGISCQIAEGTLNDEPRFWTVVETEEGLRHLDPALPEAVFCSDADLYRLGYRWDVSALPACGAPIEEEPEPDPEGDPAGEDGEPPSPGGEEGPTPGGEDAPAPHETPDGPAQSPAPGDGDAD